MESQYSILTAMIETAHIFQYFPLTLKLFISKQIIQKALLHKATDKTIIAWTGGKDSTVLLWLIKSVCEEHHIPMPTAVFINEGSVFKEVTHFCTKLQKSWNLHVVTVQNDNIVSQHKRIGQNITIHTLSKQNRQELQAIGYFNKSFPYYPESFIGNHLMKTVPFQEYIAAHFITNVFIGIRWDEHDARSREQYFSPRKKPLHTRIHPILHFSEKDIWDTIHRYDIPFVSLYSKGYRSLGAKYSTQKTANVPAWLQNSSQTSERSGRQQDKEQIMEQLRNIGYM